MSQYKPGVRLRSAVCETEVVVIAAEGETSPLLFEPVLAADGFSTHLDVFLSTKKSGKGQGGEKGPTTSLSVVPEPSSVMTLCTGMLLLLLSRRSLGKKRTS